ncbi:hypothetical protein [Streptomyces sp. NPDC048191]|uniref:hypothetical protein n=1 Tax=Streptomyces sp. NPDC048191 TaxID=3155484 RepID=UPI0033ED2E3E
MLKHLRRLKAGGALIPGDPELVSHFRADRPLPAYDLAGNGGERAEHAGEVEVGPFDPGGGFPTRH